MFNVFILQWKRLFKQPFLVGFFLLLTFVFVYFMGGAQMNSTVTVPVYTNELTSAEMSTWLETINGDSIVFEETDYETAVDEIRMNETSFAVEIKEDNYRFLVGREDEQLSVVDQHLHQIYRKESRLNKAKEQFPDEEIEVEAFITIEKQAATATNFAYDEFQLRTLIGMTLYFVMYSILYLQTNLVEEKNTGTWDRLIFSPVSKTIIYLGHLLHYYSVGLIQIGLSFLILTNVMNINLGSNFGPMLMMTLAFLFTIVALGMLLIGLVRTPQSLQVIIPIVTTAMAMLGGAFWPLEIVSNRLLLFLSDLMPIKHGLYGMIDAIQLNLPISELLQPIGILLLMGILFMGIGINLMESPSNS